MNLHRGYWATIFLGLVVMCAISLFRQQNTAAEAQVVVDRNRLRSLEARLAAARIASEKLHYRLWTTGRWEGYMRDWQDTLQLYPSPAEMCELAHLRERLREQQQSVTHRDEIR